MSTIRWHVVHCDGRSAYGAVEQMEKQGYETYYPQVRKMVRVPLRKVPPTKRHLVRGLMEPVESALFTNYIFIRFDLSVGRWHELFDLYGIRGMMVKGGLPAAIEDKIIMAIKGTEVGGAIPFELELSKMLYRVGQVVKINDGPLKSYTGTVSSLDEKHQRVLLEVLMFGGAASVEVSVDQIQPEAASA